ncbi:MAG: hypothetical protein KIH08_03230 [Candidatus Freyarchaeota archaeon]|nr:hypothetical protein [Candidatus Jordarchaeia archaeon]MBS7270092.1 hypothetical protein [Candidatus Jordarchaeia archaeon]MBS7280768.1 hypothetical protein [Candidatus Jordarchaeia archaeon]
MLWLYLGGGFVSLIFWVPFLERGFGGTFLHTQKIKNYACYSTPICIGTVNLASLVTGGEWLQRIIGSSPKLGF